MPSSYIGSELEIFIVQDNLDLVEISDVYHWFDGRGRPGGTFSISRGMLPSSEQGTAFLKLCTGSASIRRETIPSGSATHMPSFALQSRLAIRTPKRQLVEGIDFLVNWATGVVTFTPALPEAAEIAYISDAAGDPSQFAFDIVWRRRDDKAVVCRLKSCAVYHIIRSASGDEDTIFSGSFLDLEGEP
jgi:hypothetical protein